MPRKCYHDPGWLVGAAAQSLVLMTSARQYFHLCSDVDFYSSFVGADMCAVVRIHPSLTEGNEGSPGKRWRAERPETGGPDGGGELAV